MLGYFEDGPNLVTMAMNGWGDAEPAWWLNLQAHPETVVELKEGKRAVSGRAATPEERPRLWARWGEFDGPENLEAGPRGARAKRLSSSWSRSVIERRAGKIVIRFVVATAETLASVPVIQ